MANFLIRGLCKRSNKLKTIVDHLLLLVRLILLLLQPLQILKNIPGDIRCQLHADDAPPVPNRTILIGLQPAAPSLVDDSIEQVVSMQVLEKPIIVDNLLAVLEDGQGVKISM